MKWYGSLLLSKQSRFSCGRERQQVCHVAVRVCIEWNEKFRSWISVNVPYFFANPWPQKREEKSSGFGLIKLRTIYNFCTIDQNAGQNHNMKIDNSSIERVEEFKYLGTTLINQNSIQEEIKSRLKLGNAFYYSVQNLLFSSLLRIQKFKDQDI